MYRLVALLFALLLPLQFTWGAAAAYCQHETTIESSKHFGHHEHVHKTDQKAGESKPLVDNDCGTCHATCSVVASEALDCLGTPAAAKQLIASAPDTHASALARAPDRPQWPGLA